MNASTIRSMQELLVLVRMIIKFPRSKVEITNMEATPIEGTITFTIEVTMPAEVGRKYWSKYVNGEF